MSLDTKPIYPLPPIVPPPEHPRLFLRKRDIPFLNNKISRPEMSKAWKVVVEQSRESPTGAALNEIFDIWETSALVYVLRGDEQAGLKAKQLVMENISYYDERPEQHKKISRVLGEFIGKVSRVYDWCYPLFGAEEKMTIISTFKRLAARMETGYPPTNQSSVTNHAGENLLMRDLLSAGVATYDEDPEIYQLTAGRFFSEMLPARNFFYPAGMYHQGTTYGIFRYSCDLWPTFIFDRMGFENVYHSSQGDIPFQWIYMRRPDGMLMPQGDTTPNAFYPIGKYVAFHMIIYMMAASYYKNPYLMEEYYRELSARREGTDDSDDKAVEKRVYDILFNDLDLPRKPIGELPLSRYFGSPFGQMIARTGWDDGVHLTDRNSPVAVALMKIGEYNFGNHDHRDIGSFQLYYKGSLAIDSGIYQGADGRYGSPPHDNYTKATIAHNCVLVYDPNDQSTAKRNDGGQRTVVQPKTLPDLLNNEFRTGQVMGHEFGPDPIKPDYTYLKGEISKAYSNKVKQYFRSFLFLNFKNDKLPAALIVFDKVVSSDKSFKKIWLLHTIEEPLIEGTITTVRRSTDGYNGEMTNYTLLPVKENLTIEKVGGPGREFDVFGKNFPNRWEKPDDVEEQGAWRIEASPREAAETDYFLNVMLVKDIDGSLAPAPEKLETEQMTGAKILDRVVLFGKSGDRMKETVSFQVEGENTELKFLVCDQAEGKWRVEKDGRSSIHTVSEEGGVLCFTGFPGKYSLTHLNTD